MSRFPVDPAMSIADPSFSIASQDQIQYTQPGTFLGPQGTSQPGPMMPNHYPPGDLLEDDQESSTQQQQSNKRPRRASKLTPSQRERKRAIDREAQRSIRIKTKNYIAHLENLVSLMDKDGPGATSVKQADAQGVENQRQKDARTVELLSQLRQSQEEVRKLQVVLHDVRKVVGGFCGVSPDSDLLAGLTEHSQSTTAVDVANLELAASGSVGRQPDYSQPPGTSHNSDGLTRNMADPSSSYAVEQARSSGSRSSRSDTSTQRDQRQDANLQDEVYTTAVSPESPGKMSNNDVIELSDWSEREVMRVLADGRRPVANQPLDDDIAIRAVLHGWVDVQDRYILDSGWQALKSIDQTVFQTNGIIERIVILRTMRQKMLHSVHANPQGLLPLPEFLKRTPMEDPQQLKKAPIVEYYVWPNLRLQLLNNPRRFHNRRFSEAFIHNFKFNWPFEISDAYFKDPISHLYASTPAFIGKQMDLRSWTMRKDFFQGFEELYSAIPTFDVSIGRALMPVSEGLFTRDTAPWDAASSSSHSQTASRSRKQRPTRTAAGQTTPAMALPLAQMAVVAAASSEVVPSVPQSAEIEAWLGDADMLPHLWRTQQFMTADVNMVYGSHWPASTGEFR